MAAAVPLTIALERYERHGSLRRRGQAGCGGFRFDVLEVAQVGMLRDGTRREERMIDELAFDVAELSLSSYVLARSRGRPLAALPIFPRRLFSQTQIFVRAGAALRSPQDLVGKRVGIQSLQATLAVVAKGDLGAEYGVSWRDITWVVRDRETVALPPGLDAGVVRVDRDADLAGMLAAGEVDALCYSRYPASERAPDGSVRRLFADPRAEALRYYRKHGAVPIMHVLAIAQPTLAAHPTLPAALHELYAAALDDCRGAYADPAWSLLPFGRLAFEEMLAEFPSDPWTGDAAADRAYLERFIGYACDQGLILEPLSVDALFLEVR